MREVYTLVLSVSAVLLGAELLARLFPEKSGALVHALAVLAIVLALVGGLLHLDFDWAAAGSGFAAEQAAEAPGALYGAAAGAALCAAGGRRRRGFRRCTGRGGLVHTGG